MQGLIVPTGRVAEDHPGESPSQLPLIRTAWGHTGRGKVYSQADPVMS